jgi:DNA-binding NtrC family response regulator
MTRSPLPVGEPPRRQQLLLADADEQVLRGLAERLRVAYDVDAVTDLPLACQQVRAKIYDLILCDVGLLAGRVAEGRDRLREGDADRPVLVLVASPRPVEDWAAHLDVPLADLVAKPVSGSALVAAVSRALEAARQARLLRQEGRPLRFDGLLGQSPCWQHTLRLAERLAQCDETVCLLGETGTGKSHLAEALHRASARHGQPLVTAVISAGQADRQADDLFGHQTGAFTGATQARDGLFRTAHRGTLFLDEVGDLSPEAQALLLRVLEARRIRPAGADQEVAVDVRVLTATNKDLAALVKTGGFREDLYHRLNTLTLRLPPLRDRKEDLLPLACHFAQHQAETMGRHPPALAAETEQALRAYHWPGNVRELRNCMIRGVVLGGARPVILPGDCFEGGAPIGPAPSDDVLPGESLDAYLDRCRRRYLEHLMKSCNGDRKRMAHAAGLHPSTLREKLKEHLSE